jgi:hypothetical protein
MELASIETRIDAIIADRQVLEVLRIHHIDLVAEQRSAARCAAPLSPTCSATPDLALEGRPGAHAKSVPSSCQYTSRGRRKGSPSPMGGGRERSPFAPIVTVVSGLWSPWPSALMPATVRGGRYSGCISSGTTMEPRLDGPQIVLQKSRPRPRLEYRE